MTQEHTNFEILKPSRQPLHEGDVFVLKPRNRAFLFGRVVDLNAKVGAFPAILLYVYRALSPDKREIPTLRCDELLVPPILTNRLPWTRGYFETVKTTQLTPWDVLPVHCFKSMVHVVERYFDEKSRPLDGPVEPVGIHGLQSDRTIDDRVSKALGIPLAPD